MKILTMILEKLYSKKRDWQSLEYFDPKWKERIAKMAKFIDPRDSVADLGSGEGWLMEYLTPTNKYIGVDYKVRNYPTVVRNFNNYEFMDDSVDTVFVSGCLEYIEDYTWFIKSCCNKSAKVILSYCCLDTHCDVQLRKKLTWVNHLNKDIIIKHFNDSGFKLDHTFLTDNNNRIFIFINYEYTATRP